MLLWNTHISLGLVNRSNGHDIGFICKGSLRDQAVFRFPCYYRTGQQMQLIPHSSIQLNISMSTCRMKLIFNTIRNFFLFEIK
jgi:hypothetical protein